MDVKLFSIETESPVWISIHDYPTSIFYLASASDFDHIESIMKGFVNTKTRKMYMVIVDKDIGTIET